LKHTKTLDNLDPVRVWFKYNIRTLKTNFFSSIKTTTLFKTRRRSYQWRGASMPRKNRTQCQPWPTWCRISTEASTQNSRRIQRLFPNFSWDYLAWSVWG